MSRNTISDAWSWRHAIIKSNLQATTRHVLLTLSCRMDDCGGSCFPSVAEIVSSTGLGKTTVVKHLQIAEDTGWLRTNLHGYKGQKWRRKEYEAAWPDRDVFPDNLEPEPEPDGAPEIAEGGSGDEPPLPPKAVREVNHLSDEGGSGGEPKVVREVVHYRDHSIYQSKDSPPNPPAGGEGEISEFEDFKTKYGLPQADWPKARRKWDKLKPAERHLFVEAAETYQRRCDATTEKQITPAVFLGRADFAKKICSEAVVVLDHWSRGWWAWFFAQRDRGETLAFAWQMACRRGGTQSQTVNVGDAPSAAVRDALVPVLRDSEAGRAWAKWLSGRKFDLPDFEGDWRIWMPGQWPDGETKNGGAGNAGSDDRAGERPGDRRYG